MTTVNQQNDHELQPIKGYYQFVALDKTAPIDETALESYSDWPAGRVGYITSSGTIALANGASCTNEMPLYLWQGGDLGTIAQGVGADDTIHWQNTLPAGLVTGLVATGGYELQTTEFDSDETYAPNTFLTTTLDAQHVPGLIVPITGKVINNWICGIASLHCQERWDLQTTPTSAKGTNANGKSVLTFWSYFLPKLEAAI